MMLVVIQTISFIIGVLGGVIIAVGVIHSFALVLKHWFLKPRHSEESVRLDRIRLDLGRYVVLGLEFFIAKDIIETLIVPSWSEVGILVVFVIIRTILSFFLARELHQIEKRKIEHRKIDAGIR